jgi:hypothetical protein
MRICSKCKTKKDESDYYVKDSVNGRLHAQCKSCYREHRVINYRKHYETYKVQYRERAKIRRTKKRNEYREKLLEFLQNKQCELCGEADIRTLEFDHIDPTLKTFSISQGVKYGYTWDQIENEIIKCRILCANCHKKHTSDQFGWYKSV